MIFAFDASISNTELRVSADGRATVKSLYTDPVFRINGLLGFDILIFNDLEGRERIFAEVVGADAVAP